ncbi:26611_t:CDS:2, partial [Racocetra persica]
SEISRRDRNKENLPRPIELFKLHLGDVPEVQKPKLPFGLSSEKAITDYLHKMGTDFFKMVRLVATIPAEFTEETKAIMRQCIYDANLISNSGTQNLQFTTEPEAAAVHCMKVLNDHGLKAGSTFLIVDCGGGTVDLTVRKLLKNNQLSEITERTGGFCGGSYVDKNFIKYLEDKVGKNAISYLRDKNYRQFHYMIHQFCERVKIPFTDNISDFRTFEFDIVKYCPALKNYVNGTIKDVLEDED